MGIAGIAVIENQEFSTKGRKGHEGNQPAADKRKTSARRTIAEPICVGLRWSAALLVLACSVAVVAQAPDAGYRAEFAKWQQEQIKDLKENWLPLVGLFWLKEGDNPFGSAKDARVWVERSYLLRREGSFRLNKGQVWFDPSPASHVRLGKARIPEVKLTPSPPGPPTVLEAGPLRMFIIQRGSRYGVRVKDLDSPAVRQFKGLEWYPLDGRYVVTADLVAGNGRTMMVPNIIGDKQETPVAGEVRFRLNGQDLRLDAMDGGNGALFIVFSDLTKKKDTYPGGRFLDVAAPRNGKVILDFNEAYSPPCAFTPYATCPLPPKENQLQVEISAGEKYSGHH